MLQTQFHLDIFLLQESLQFILDMDPRMVILLYKYGVKTSLTLIQIPDALLVLNQSLQHISTLII